MSAARFPFQQNAIVERAPAKVNLALHVVGRRPDGHHELESLVAFTDAADVVTVCPAPADAFSIDGPFARGVPTGSDNLVVKARNAIREIVLGADAPEGEGSAPRNAGFARADLERAGTGGEAAGGAAVALTKNLPVASGIGGGSSDAAAVLKALNRLWGAKLPLDRLAERGEALGADVPMCVYAEPLLARGIGERIEPVHGLPPLALVLANPGVAIGTPDVFKALAFKVPNRCDDPGLPPLPPQLTAGTLHRWLKGTRNDLQEPATALAPAIAEAIGELERAGALLARMSGSGATCFGLFPTPAEARRAAAAIAGRRSAWWVKATGTMPSSPSRSRASA